MFYNDLTQKTTPGSTDEGMVASCMDTRNMCLNFNSLFMNPKP